MSVLVIGALCFGVVIGYITYRTLARTETSSVSDIAAVVAAVGGGVVTTLFDPSEGDLFAWYSIGLLLGMAVFLILGYLLSPPKNSKLAFPTIAPDQDKPATEQGP